MNKFWLALFAFALVLAAASADTVNINWCVSGCTPATTTINAGDTVVWHNTDSGITHSVTQNSPGTLDSHDLKGGNTYTHTFASGGVFVYHCRYHTFMTGTLNVNGTVTGNVGLAPPSPAPGTLSVLFSAVLVLLVAAFV